MLVSNTKCTICGANKVTSNKSMYIYCDYCGSWMGYDMDAAGREAAKVFTVQSMSDPKIIEYNKLNALCVESAKAKNKEEYINTRILIHEKEFELFPDRHGPKGKQPGFRKKYLDYYRAMYEDMIDEDYFERTFINPPQISSEELKYTVENGVVKYEFDEAFFKYFDENLKIVKDSIERSRDFKSLELHPEYEVVKNSDLMYKITILTMIQGYGPDAAEPILKHLGIEDQMIEVPDVRIDALSCVVCNTEILVPEGADHVMCVECGCKNEIGTRKISCPNCSAPFDPIKENETCPYCSSKIEKPKSMHDFIKEKYDEAINPTKAKKKQGLFGRLFG